MSFASFFSSVKSVLLQGIQPRYRYSPAVTAMLALSSCASTDNAQLAMSNTSMQGANPRMLIVQVEDDARTSGQVKTGVDPAKIAAALKAQLVAQLGGNNNVITLPQGSNMPAFPRNTVLLRCDIEKINPGNEGLRLAVGFGSGKATLQIVTQLIAFHGGQSVTLMSFNTRSTTGALPGPALGFAGALNAGQLIGIAAGSAGLLVGANQSVDREVEQSSAKIAMQTKTFFEQNGWVALAKPDVSQLGEAQALQSTGGV